MVRFYAFVLLCLFCGMTDAKDISVDGPKVKETTEGDCVRLENNARDIVSLRDQGYDQPAVTAVLLRHKLLDDDQYQRTLPLLMAFANEAFKQGKGLPSDDLVTVMGKVCRSSKEWVYF